MGLFTVTEILQEKLGVMGGLVLALKGPVMWSISASLSCLFVRLTPPPLHLWDRAGSLQIAVQPCGGKWGVCQSEIVLLGHRDTVTVETRQGRLEMGSFAASPALKQVWCL